MCTSHVSDSVPMVELAQFFAGNRDLMPYLLCEPIGDYEMDSDQLYTYCVETLIGQRRRLLEFYYGLAIPVLSKSGYADWRTAWNNLQKDFDAWMTTEKVTGVVISPFGCKLSSRQSAPQLANAS